MMNRFNFIKLVLLFSCLVLLNFKSDFNFITKRCVALNKSQISIDHQKIAKEELATRTQEELDRDWSLESFFGSIYVINLPQAHTRREQIAGELNAIGAKNFTIFPAIDGRKDVKEAVWGKLRRKSPHAVFASPEKQNKYVRMLQGQAGCYLSHMQIVETVREKFNEAVRAYAKAKQSQNQEKIKAALAQVKKYSSVLILEDDNNFGIVGLDRKSVTKESVGSIFRKAMLELPSDWDMLYLMSFPYNPTKKENEHIARLDGAVVLNAYAISYRLYDKLYNHLKKISSSRCRKVRPVDVEYSRLHRKTKSYGIVPSIAFQNTGVSLITSVTSNHLRQTQSFQDGQTEQFINEYSPLLLHPFSKSAEKDTRFQFQEDACTLKELQSCVQKLEENGADGFRLLRKHIARRFDEFLKRKIVEGKKHCFDENLSARGLPHFVNLNANDVEMEGGAKYLLCATPESLSEVHALFDAALQKSSTLFVSVIRSEDAEERWNKFWEKETLRKITTPDGWTIQEISRKALVAAAQQAIIESKLEAISKTGEKRILTHLHYDGWQQDTSMPNRALFQALLDRMDEVQGNRNTPIVIHSKWGVGRNGVAAVCHFLRHEVQRQMANGVPLDQVTINIPKVIFDFRKQRNGFVEHQPLLHDVHLVMLDHYEHLKSLNKDSS